MSTKKNALSLKRLCASLGPGLLFASTAIGVSHLVQSTRAGADFGMGLLWAVIAANLFKFPFFEYGSRYAIASGESLIDGYKRMGSWMLGLYALITLMTMCLVGGAVGAVTAGFLDNLWGISATLGDAVKPWISVLLLGICGGILLWGQYSLLDRLVKVIAAVLLITTCIAFVLTLGKVSPGAVQLQTVFDWSDTAHVAFLIALMGWMPTALDLSTWNSLWTIEKLKTNSTLSVAEVLREFRLSYMICAILAVCFVTMGAVLMHGSGETLSGNSAAFANQVVVLYTKTLGEWSYLIIAASAFSIMFGTSLTVLDGYARSARRVVQLFLPEKTNNQASFISMISHYHFWILAVMTGSLVVILGFGDRMRELVDLATRMSFFVAPIIAIANFYLVCSRFTPKEAHPSFGMKILSVLGIAFLSAFSVFYFSI